MKLNFLKFWKPKQQEEPKLSQFSKAEIKIYEVPTSEAAEHFFRIQLENEALKRQLRECDNDFEIRVGLEVQMQTSMLAEENHRLRRELHALKQQKETLN